jgi:hypothetical protein
LHAEAFPAKVFGDFPEILDQVEAVGDPLKGWERRWLRYGRSRRARSWLMISYAGCAVNQSARVCA